MAEIKKETEKPEEEDLVWQRCGTNSLLIQGLEEMLSLLSHTAKIHVKETEKQIDNLKRLH